MEASELTQAFLDDELGGQLALFDEREPEPEPEPYDPATSPWPEGF